MDSSPKKSWLIGRVRKAARIAIIPANPMSSVSKMLHYVEEDTLRVASIFKDASRSATHSDLDLAAIADPHDRFMRAISQQGVGEADIPNIERTAKLRFQIYFLATVLALGYAILAPAFGLLGHSLVPLLNRGLPWIFLPPFIAQTVRASYVLYQVRRRAMVPLRDWLADPAAWLGGGEGLSALLLLLTVGAGFGAIIPSDVLAGTTAPASNAAGAISQVTSQLATMTHSNDLSLNWLMQLFPGAAAAWGGTASGTDVWVPLFSTFNGIICYVGAMMLCWHSIAGIANTAHSGKVLGEVWNTMWAPIRVVGGFALTVPVNGYCMAQLLVIMVISWGYALANLEWNAYVATMIGPSASTLVAPSTDSTSNMVTQVLRAETCAQTLTMYQNEFQAASSTASAVVNALTFNLFASSRPAYQLPPTGGTPTGDGIGTVWDYGQVCGMFKITAGSYGSTTANLSGATNTVNSTNQDSFTNMQAEQAAYTAFDQARVTQFGTFVAAIRGTGLPNDIAASTSVGPNSADNSAAAAGKMATISTAAQTFNTSIASAAATMSNTLDVSGRASFQQTATDLGWASAGALNFTLARLSAEVTDHVQGSYPAASDIQLDKVDDASEVKGRLNTALKALGALSSATQESAVLSRGDVQVREDYASWNPLSILFKPLGDRIAKGMTTELALDPVHPMSDIMALGNGMMVAGETLFVSYVGMRAAAGTAEKALENGVSQAPAAIPEGALQALIAVGSYVQMVSATLMIMGAMEAYVLPLVSYIMWLFAVMACIGYVIELVMAAPIAAFQHIRMDGRELIDQHQRTIYLMMFNGALRPTFLLFGLIASNIVFSVMAGFVNKTFAAAMLSSQGNNIIGVIGQVTMVGVLLYVHYQLAVRSMSLVHQIPAMVSEILGARDASRGEEQHGSNVVGAIVNTAHSGGRGFVAAAMTPREGGRGGGGGGSAPKPDTQDDNKSEEQSPTTPTQGGKGD